MAARGARAVTILLGIGVLLVGGSQLLTGAGAPPARAQGSRADTRSAAIAAPVPGDVGAHVLRVESRPAPPAPSVAPPAQTNPRLGKDRALLLWLLLRARDDHRR